MMTTFNFTKLLLAAMALMISVLAFSAQALEYLSPLPDSEQFSGGWLASTENKGLVVLSGDLQELAAYPGRYEQTSAVAVSDGKVLIAAVNQDHNSLDLLTWNGKQLTLLDRQAEPLLAVTGVCLYQEPVSQNIHAFILKEHTETEQRLLFQADKQRVLNMPVRTLPVPDGVAACGVDHQRQTLYFAEENIGIWRMSAHPESTKNREAVALVAPFGDLKEDIESLMVLPNGSVIVPQKESLATYHSDGKKQIIAVAGLQEAIAINRTSTNKIELLTGESLNELKSVNLSVDINPLVTAEHFVQIPATAETDTVQKFGDAADDPAIWFNPKNPEASLILGTDKKRGLAVYNLEGTELQFLEVGRINNVDLRGALTIEIKNRYWWLPVKEITTALHCF